MARATRSAATTTTPAEKDKPTASPPASRKGASKKRKRNSNVENGDSPPSKHARTDSKDEGSVEPQAPPEEKHDVELPSSGDIPIRSTDAANILEVLEMVDTQGLLDRVFPLPIATGETTSAESSSGSSTTMLSFRSLLKNASQYPLSVLRSAVKHLYPISFHPRSRPSEPAAQQLHFCDLATSLLDEASRNNAQIPLHVESLISDGGAQSTDDVTPASPTSPTGLRPRKYALVQHLPTGDWWSSVSSDSPAADEQEKDLKSLYTAKADLVAIFPSSSSPELAQKHTLGDYVTKKPTGTARYRPAPPRRVSCGKFLYYGPYASFAPCFDQDGVEVGRIAMGEVIFQQEMKRRFRALVKGKRKAFEGSREGQTEDVDIQEQEPSGENAAGPSDKPADIVKGIEALLPAEEVDAIKASLGTLEMELAVDELLQRNAKALQRLEELQLARLREQGSGSSIVEVGSEEWVVAQGIMESLALLASLRPRPSNGDSNQSPLVPPPSVLHKLQRTLPVDATEGWYGTLPEGRTTAFRDDTTVHIRSTAAAASTTKPTAPAAVPTTPAPKTPAAAPSTTYTPYGYPSTYQNSQYRGGYGTYNPGQSTGNYYPNYAAQTTAATTPTTPAQAGTTSHYPNAAYSAAAAGQQPQTATGGYTYSPWYGGYQTGTASGRATPQPATSTTGYGGYYAASAGQASTAQRAVANTVMPSAAKPYQPATWTGAPTAPGAYAPTLPPHMRGAAAATPGTPPPAGTGAPGGYAGYYGGYQATR
ncbi:hypothetical protein C8Q77DRAFT_1213715 [Trametes polyzona]|nr:hypothetical protein C8Q77DRAFT_1213715 [Trametes polyzona]